MDVVFVTGNVHKAKLLSELLGLPIDHASVDIDEIQSADIVEVGIKKAKSAYDVLKRPVLIDDFGSFFDALKGLPGAFTKFFVDANNGAENMCRMLDGFSSRSASVSSVMVFYDGDELKVFKGEVKGSIVQHPAGTRGIGTDCIFAPDGYSGRTRAELSKEEYDEVYMRVRPIQQVKEYLETRYA